ncbi:MAG: chromosomal replication initiator protein DnaA [Hyphomicrobiales bacterium]|nr:chromosomal replication initiator protein DnaA [Hyphomicrobiales bacterium]
MKKNDEENEKKRLQENWARIKARLRVELGEDVFTSWFGRVELDALNGKTLHLSVPTRFLKNWLQAHYCERLMICSKDEFPDITRIEFRVRRPHDVLELPAAEKQGISPSSGAAAIASPAEQAVGTTGDAGGQGDLEGSPLDPRFTFDSFVAGSANRLVCAAAREVAESVAQSPLRYNPLYIHSNVGLGKTHLLNAVSWHVRSHAPRARVLYLTAERFMSKFVHALRNRDAVAFKEKLRGIDLLLIDDMEFLQGPTIQQEFCHALNSLIDGGRQVVVAADRAPAQLERLDARMRSRLAGGLVAEIGPMDYDLRQAILKKRSSEEHAQDAGFVIPEQVVEFLANRLTESGRELEGAIVRMRAAWHLTAEPINVDRAEYIVRDLMRGTEPKRIKIDDILRIISKHFGVNRSDLLSARRNRSIVRPRQIGMYLAKHLTSRSLPEIGRRFGNRDHTTVLHAIRKIDELMKEDSSLREEIELLKRLLKD